jgi:5-methylcytosine-specific restriction endonuclease McrA
MRPIRRGSSPRQADFTNYREALPDLVGRLGMYCSYCERRIPTQLAVEHIQPKGLPASQALQGRWENFLLACVNCNSIKKDKPVSLADLITHKAPRPLRPAPGRAYTRRRHWRSAPSLPPS